MLASATDLHLRQGSPCIGAATPISGIDFDIDGDPRDPAHPDIGADEFTVVAVEQTPIAKMVTDNAVTVARGMLVLSEATGHLLQAASLLDAAGRKVAELHAGANDVSHLAPGVYFVRQASGVAKVVIAR